MQLTNWLERLRTAPRFSRRPARRRSAALARCYSVDTGVEILEDRRMLNGVTVTADDFQVSTKMNEPLVINESEFFEHVSHNGYPGTSYLFLTSVGEPPEGEGTTLLDDGNVTFTPAQGFSGTTTFTYTVEYDDLDGFGTGSDTGTVTVDVLPGPVEPFAVDVAYEMRRDGLLLVGAERGLLSGMPTEQEVILGSVFVEGEEEDEGNGFTISAVFHPADGKVLDYNAEGSFLYMPNEGFTGTDTFVFAVRDSEGNTDFATATITVHQILDAQDDRRLGWNGHPLEMTVESLLANDTAPAGTPVMREFTLPDESEGTLDYDEWNGTFTFTPADGFTGEATFTYTIGNGPEQLELQLDAPHQYAEFGSSVAIDGNIAVIGAPDENNYEGAAYIFQLIDGEWLQSARLASEVEDGYFGKAVAVSGTTVVVGAPDEDDYTGRVYVYDYDSHLEKWVLADTLQHEDALTDDEFGYSVAIDGNTIVVGAPWRGYSLELVGEEVVPEIEDPDWYGAAFIFARGEEGWEQIVEIDGSDVDGTPWGRFGYAVAISGQTVLIGEPRAYDDQWDNNGAAYIFTYDGDWFNFFAWDDTQRLTAGEDHMQEDARFGSAVAIEGRIAVIGAPREDIDDMSRAGAAYWFVLDIHDKWVPMGNDGRLTAGDDASAGAQFGHSVAVSGTEFFDLLLGSEFGLWFDSLDDPISQEQLELYMHDAYSQFGVLVGARREDVGTAEDAGAAYLFELGPDDGFTTTRLTNAHGAEDDEFGSAVALSGKTALIGSPHADVDNLEYAGQAHILNVGTSTATVTVGPIFNQSYEMWRDDQLTVTAEDGLLSDPEGQYLSGYAVPVVYSVANGTVEFNTDGSFLYTPNEGFVGTDTFYYAVQDVDGATYFGQATIEVKQFLEAFDDHLKTKEDTPLSIPYEDLLANDTVSDGGHKRIAEFTEPPEEEGTLVDNGDGTFTFTPADDWHGTTSFTYTISDGEYKVDLTADYAAEAAMLGYTVAMDGDIAVIGAPFDSQYGHAAGAAYIFVRSEGTWVQSAKLTPENLSANDEFGTSVAVSGTTVVIGAPYDDHNGHNNAGAVYVYEFDAEHDSWNLADTLMLADGAQNGDRFGTAVAINGDTIVVGAPFDNERGTNAGAAYVYVRAEEGWELLTQLTAGDTAAANNYFGSAVAVSGNKILIGEPNANTHAGTNAGAAYLFEFLDWSIFDVMVGSVMTEVEEETGPSWDLSKRFTGDQAHAAFGHAVALHGELMVIGSPYHDVGGHANSGMVTFIAYGWNLEVDGENFSYAEVENTMTITDEDNAAANRNFGWSLAMTAGNVSAFDMFGNFEDLTNLCEWEKFGVLIGAPGEANDDATTGSAYLFTFDLESGLEYGDIILTKLTADEGADGNQFGTSVALSGTTALIGAPGTDVEPNVELKTAGEAGPLAGAGMAHIRELDLSTATVYIEVEAVNDPPVAVDDAYYTPPDTQLVVNAENGILANDYDVDGDAIKVIAAFPPQHGQVTVAADGSFVYTPKAGFVGADSFMYAISDPSGAVDFGTVTINVGFSDSLAIAPLLDQYVNVGDDPLQVQVAAADDDKHTLTYTAEARLYSLAYEVDQAYGLHFKSSYFLDYLGQNEKWMMGNDGWYYINPEGELFRWRGGRGGTKVAQLGSAHYNNPETLYNAQPGAIVDVVAVDGHLLTVTPDEGFVGTIVVTVTVGHDDHHASETFEVTVGHNLADGLDRRFGLYATGNFHFNWGGLGEKWLKGAREQWYYITPDGDFFRWHGSGHVDNATWIATLDSSYYTHTGLLHQAQNVALDRDLGLRVDNGLHENAFGKQEKWLRAANGQWYFITPNGELTKWDNVAGSATGTLVAHLDRAVYDNPWLLHSAQNFQLDSDLGLRRHGHLHLNAHQKQEKWVRAADEQWYFITANGELTKWDNVPNSGAGTVIAKLDAQTYQKPEELYNALDILDDIFSDWNNW